MKMQKITAPSCAAVKCKLCKKQFCNKAYFLKHHYKKEHKQSQVDAETQWEFVVKRAGISKWEEKADPNLKKQKNPFTMARTARILIKTPTKAKEVSCLSPKPVIKFEKNSDMKPNPVILKRKRIYDIEGQEDEPKMKRSRITELEAENKRLKSENEFLKREREENATKESMTLKSLQSMQKKSGTFIMELKATVQGLKEYHEHQKEEATEMQNTTRRDWILRKTDGRDERRFCLPCLKFHQSPGHNLGNLAKSPFVNGGVSVWEMKEKATRKKEKPSQL